MESVTVLFICNFSVGMRRTQGGASFAEMKLEFYPTNPSEIFAA
jgi:hypothetical protein